MALQKSSHGMKRTMSVRWLVAFTAAACVWGVGSFAGAQQNPPVHLHYEASWPPGMVGQHQLRGDIRRVGYFQPVELQLPEGSMVAMAEGGAFNEPQPTPLKVGLQLGQVYRFQVSRVPLREGAEIFPTLEVIDRLHPPEGGKWRFPVPVQITMNEIDLALAGKYVTRVIYVEPPTQALPHVVDRRFQPYFEVRPGTDPLEVADQLGRPIAILRIGSRVPDRSGPDNAFLYGSPPLEHSPGEEIQRSRWEIIPSAPPPRVPLPRSR